MGLLVRVMYGNQTQSVFRLDRVKSSSFDCLAKIPVDSNARYFMVRVMYGSQTQSVFILDRVKSSSCDCLVKIPVDSNARYFTCFCSGSSSPEVAEFCQTLCLVYFIARA
jgi:hypothetical protein